MGGEAAAAVEELVSGVRQAADFAEQFRSYSESEKQWKARMEFILRHLPDYRDPPDGGGRLDRLLSLSMVWANHLFLGCRCGPLPSGWPWPQPAGPPNLSQGSPRTETPAPDLVWAHLPPRGLGRRLLPALAVSWEDA